MTPEMGRSSFIGTRIEHSIVQSGPLRADDGPKGVKMGVKKCHLGEKNRKKCEFLQKIEKWCLAAELQLFWLGFDPILHKNGRNSTKKWVG